MSQRAKIGKCSKKVGIKNRTAVAVFLLFPSFPASRWRSIIGTRNAMIQQSFFWFFVLIEKLILEMVHFYRNFWKSRENVSKIHGNAGKWAQNRLQISEKCSGWTVVPKGTCGRAATGIVIRVFLSTHKWKSHNLLEGVKHPKSTQKHQYCMFDAKFYSRGNVP